MPVVLLVEDEPHIVKLVTYVLRQSGLEVRTAETGQAALDLVRQEQIDLILMDLMLPGMDGYYVCHRLKADPHTKHIPIVILSARFEADQALPGTQGEVAAYISKPFEPMELCRRIWQVLQEVGQKRDQ
ncbi:MAG: response regulator transcription factor [Candidatus Methylomirabilales bacterium]